jgi:hypothetical protein
LPAADYQGPTNHGSTPRRLKYFPAAANRLHFDDFHAPRFCRFYSQRSNDKNDINGNAAMKTPLPNVEPLAPFDGLPPLNKLDQAMIRRLRELANQRGCSVENLIREALGQWLARCEAEREAEAKHC